MKSTESDLLKIEELQERVGIKTLLPTDLDNQLDYFEYLNIRDLRTKIKAYKNKFGLMMNSDKEKIDLLTAIDIANNWRFWQ